MRQSYLRKTLGVLCFVIILLAVQAAVWRLAPARADVAPPSPPVGSDIFPPVETTNVRMVAETVVIDVARNSPFPDGHATITAEFQMRNLGDTPEQMVVRFPLSHIEWQLQENYCSLQAGYPQIDFIAVWIDGSQAEVTKTFETVPDFEASAGTPSSVTIPCWAHFLAIFPPGQDVSIVVKYTVVGYRFDERAGNISFAYVLFTGAGWKDTIGEAHIRLRYPYELNPMTFLACRPDCSQAGSELRWDFKDFEPTGFVDGVISASIMLPSLWQRILIETQNTTANPQDGEAWGRLGKAYKDAIMERRGFRDNPLEMYQRSQGAYQEAVTLLPNDADWHYGYAELLCWGAEWGVYVYDAGPTRIYFKDDWVPCVEQLKQALDLDPEHERANELLDDLSYQSEPRLFDLSGAQPDYLILTPQPTASPAAVILPDTPSDTPPPSATAPPSPMPTRTSPPPQATTIASAPTEAASPAAALPTPAPSPAGISAPSPQPSRSLVVDVIAFLLILAAALALLRKR